MLIYKGTILVQKLQRMGQHATPFPYLGTDGNPRKPRSKCDDNDDVNEN